MEPASVVAVDLRLVPDTPDRPAKPSLACSVVLVAPASAAGGDPGGLEVTFVRRATTMAFASGALAFPGGRVDEQDFDTSVPFHAFDAADWARRLGVPPRIARALLAAAVRETFEETGVLLAGPTEGEVLVSPPVHDSDKLRARLERKEVSFADVLRFFGAAVQPELLVPWTRWLTPAWEPRRYRTWFFAARMPAQQVPRQVSTETDEVVSLPVRAAITRAAQRKVLLLPPQYCTCLELYGLQDPEGLSAASPWSPDIEITPTIDRETDPPSLGFPERLTRLGRGIGRELGLE